MSIEDSRISAVENENASHDLISDIHQDARLQTSALGGVEVAQANSTQPADQQGAQSTETTGRLPAAQEAAAAAPAGQVVPDQNNIAHLPAGTAIDDIHVRGNDLVLVQADGTEIVIVNGALHVPTFLLGEVELPQQAVIAALEQSNINVAAGPDGSYSASSSPSSSGANFQDTTPGNAGDPTQLASLLADTQQADGAPERTPDEQNGVPLITASSISLVTEVSDANGAFSTQVVNGQFGFIPGKDFGVITAVGLSDSLNMDEGTQNGTHVDLTSNGQPVVVTINGLTITGSVDGQPVFTLTVTNTLTGAYTFTQFGPLDHPDRGESGADDVLRLQFSYTVTDKDGDSVTGIGSVDIRDDAPVIDLKGASDDSVVSEGGLRGAESPAVTGSISLGVQWGADNGSSRDLTFNAQSAPSGLQSHGQDILYRISADGHTLTGYTETVIGEGSEAVVKTTDVFVVTLDPTAEHGAYTFTLLTSIDHPQSGPGAGEGEIILLDVAPSQDQQIDLTFAVTAKDADGDTVPASFTVTVNDDVPTANTVTNETIMQDDLQTLFPGNSNLGVTSVKGEAGALFTTGADGFKSIVLGGEQMSFSAIYKTDKGFAAQESVSWGKGVVDGGDTTFTATGEHSKQTVATFIVHADGSYEFIVSAPIVHSQSGQDNFGLTVNFTVTDGDGDTSHGWLDVTINDDAPTASTVNVETKLDDDAQSLFPGNAGGNGDVADAKSISGEAGTLFKAGADGIQSVAFTAPTGIQAIHDVNGHGVAENLVYTTTTNDAGATILTATGKDSGDLVFTLTVKADGSYTFDLSAPLVHGTTGATEDNLPVTIGFQVTDGDGDIAKGSLTINVNDDAPTTTGTVVTVTADEGDISNLLSNGNSPFDGSGDGSTSNLSLLGVGYAATVSGSVASTVAFGADGSAATGAFSFTANAAATLASIGLSSKGGELAYAVVGNTIIGYVNNIGRGYDPLFDRPVLSFTLNSDGSFKYQQYDQLDHAAGNGANTDLKTDTGTVSGIDFGSVIKATDGDGDSVVIGGKLVVTVTDDVPTVSISLTGRTVIHDETTGRDANSNDSTAAAASRPFGGFETANHIDHALGNARNGNAIVNYGSSVGTDEPSKVSLTLHVTDAASGLKTVDNEAITLHEEGGLVVGRDAHGDAVFAISLDGEGRVSIAQYQAIQHPVGTDANDLVNLAGKISAVVTAIDYDGDVATKSVDIGGQIQFRDDAPVLSGSSVTVTADEGDIFNVLSQGNSAEDGTRDGSSSDWSLLGVGLAATVSGSIASTVSFGADGAANGGGFSFAANATATLTALGLSSQGGQLSYAVVGNAIIGYVNVIGQGYNPLFDRPVLSLTLNSDGSFKFQQYDQLDHVAGNGANTDLKTTTGSVAGIDFGSVIKATDGDGDSITLGGKLVVKITDDVPTVSISLTGRIVTHDESIGVSANSDDVKPADVASIFAAFEKTAGTALGYAREAGAIVNYGSSVGTDGQGKTTLTLGITNSDTGLLTTAGKAITLSMSNGLVIGRDSDGKAVFAISIDSDGRVSIAQYQAIKHPDGSNANDLVDLTGKISAVVTATDYDGDTVTKSVDIGKQIQFRDDAPVLKAVSSVSLSEDDLANGSSPDSSHVSVKGDLDISLGVDGGKVVLAADGAKWDDASKTLTAGDGSWKVTLGNDGKYTFTLLHSTAHTGVGADNLNVAVTYTATDNDGDSITGNFTVTIKDDVPTASYSGRITVQETANTDGSFHQTSATGTMQFVAGADGAKVTAISYELGTNAAPKVADEDAKDYTANAMTSGGQAVHIVESADHLTLTGVRADGKTVFVVEVTNAATGEYKYTQSLPLDQPDRNETGSADGIVMKIGFTVTDGDGDTASRSLQIAVNDDGPKAYFSNTVTVTEAGTDNGQFIQQSVDGKLLFDGGADGAQITSIVYRFGNTIMEMPEAQGESIRWPALTSNGQAITVTTSTDGLTVTGKVGNVEIFSLHVTDAKTGAYTFTQSGPIDHPDKGEAGAADSLRMVFDFVVTDKDGDTATNAVQVDIRDDAPTAGYAGRITVQETANTDGSFHDTSATGTMSFHAGADGAKITSIAYGVSGGNTTPSIFDANVTTPVVTVPLKSGGETIHIEQAGALTLVGKLADGTPIFKVEVTNAATGEYKFTQLGPIDHPDGAKTGADDGLRMKIVYTVTDADGDTATGSVQIDINDGGPTINGTAHAVNLLTNGDFSGGTWAHTESWGVWATEATGWKIDGTAPGQTGVQLEKIASGYGGLATSNGHPMVDLGATPGNVAISQSVTGLTAGDKYTISFEVGSSNFNSAHLEVHWNNQVYTIPVTSQMKVVTLEVTADNGANTLTFKETGDATDNVGTYLANVSLTHGAPVPVFAANAGEDDGAITFNLHDGNTFSFGADGAGEVTFATSQVTISTPSGMTVTLDPKSYSYDADTGIFTIHPGSGFNALSKDEIATLTVPFTVTDADGDSKSAVYQVTIHGANDNPIANDDVFSSVPTGWTLDAASGHAYIFKPTDNSETWDKARVDAAQLLADNKSYLATITSAHEQNVVLGVVNHDGGKPEIIAYLGGTDEGHEGHWVWATGPEAGQPFVYTNWDANEPNNSNGNENILWLYGQFRNGVWNDATSNGLPFGGYQFGYVAEAGQPGSYYAAINEDHAYKIDASLLLANDKTVDIGDKLSVIGFDQAGAKAAISAMGAAISFDGTSFSYDASASAQLQHLAEGEKTTDTFSYTISDGQGGFSTATVTVTVEGRNDIAVITAASGADLSVTEESDLIAGGKLNIVDVDHDQQAFAPQTDSAGTYGKFTIGTDGTWTYTADNSTLQSLAADEHKTESFTVWSKDGSASQVLTITITGTNDAAVISGTTTGSVTEDAVGINASAPLYKEDFSSDNSASGWGRNALVQTRGFSQHISENNFGDFDGRESISKTITLAPAGSAGPAVAQIEFDFIKIDSWDRGEQLKVYLNNGMAFAFTPKNTGNDGLDGTTGTFTAGGITGTYVITSSGVDTQMGGSDYYLDRIYHIVITAEGVGNQLTLGFGNTLNEYYTNEDFGIDNIVIRDATAGQLFTQGNLTVVDIDHDQSSFIAQQATAGKYGTFTLDTTGHWTYTADNANPDIQALKAGASTVDSFTVQSIDGTSKTVTVTINGTNDAPTAIALSNNTVSENEAGALIGTLTTTDKDVGDTYTYTVSDDRFEVVDGSLKLKNNVLLDYEAKHSIDITVTSKDSGNLTTSQTFTIQVGDVNEKPNAGADFTVNAAENVSDTTVLAKITATDPDAGNQNLKYSIFADASGKFEVNQSTGEVSLKSGASLDYETAKQHVVTVRVTDGGNLTDDVQVTIKVIDVNEKPDAGADFTVSAAENVGHTVVLAKVTATDPDAGNQNLKYSIASDVSGKFEVNQTTGEFSLKSGASLDYETAQQHVVTVRVTDGGNLSDDVQVTIKVTDVNDAPVGKNGTVTATEDTAYVFKNSDFSFTDADGDALKGVKITTLPTNGTLKVDGSVVVAGAEISAADIAAGKLTFTAAANAAGVNYANFTFQIHDNGGTANGGVDLDPTPKTITVNVTAVDDGLASLTLANSTHPNAAAPTVGDVLTAKLGNDPDGATSGVTYHWLKDGAAIAGATSSTYTLTNADVGKQISVYVTYTDGQNFPSTTDTVQAGTVVSANHAPTGADKAIDIVEDVSHTFQTGEFGYKDLDNDAFAGVVIQKLPASSSGMLLYANSAVTVGMFISAADIAAGMLVYVPKNDLVDTNRGANDTSFTFQVQDSAGALSAAENKITLDLGTMNYRDEQLDRNEYALFDVRGNGIDAHPSVIGNTGVEIVALDTVRNGATTFSDLDIARVDNNLELSWSSNNGSRTLTMLDEFGGAKRIEGLHFDNGGTFAGYSLGTDVYTIIDGKTGSSGNDLIAGSGAHDTLVGGGGNDLIFGGGGNDTLSGGLGNDLLVGGAGADKFVWGTENLNSSNADVIADYSLSEGDKIDLQNLVPSIANNKSISDYVRLYDNGSVLQVQVSISGQNGGWTTAYTLAGVRTNGVDSVRIHVAGQDYIFTDDGKKPVTSAIDPIILDLDHNGIALTTLEHGVSFDINADGHQDKIAWTAGSDGILAYDVDGNGKIDNGSEIFSPHFAGGNYVDGLQALATLDSNHDGKIDANDEAFSKLTIWQDLNHNGISDAGELSSLADHQIASLSLDAHASDSTINGQAILADGSYTLTDGSTGHFVEVAFDATLGSADDNHAYSLIGSDGNDVLSGAGGMVTLTGGAGADTFVLDADALSDVKIADVITDYKAGEGDTLDVSKLLDSLLGHQATEAEALSSVKTTVQGADTVVSVNANGGWHDVAVLQNTTEAVKILFDDKHDTTTAPHVG
ncbi:VCBS domain-containing protein [Rhizobium sp. 16-449-1b]|uniref:T1SS-143 repeat domain-containing protein n=1 Tax=Rhizobium sp. 16-449-1b TaxID=2819989 RepID=UPI001AD9740D|nr:DUF5801 repeats-in-toxin domain-containing protein [Rhizobium sp. 16-449-1b]MBO9193450.1 VCBS domain-containing protein [Rhizobium sp. 16-449-1b]